METFELTNYKFYSSRLDMELITTIVDALKEILEEDKKQEQPLFLKVADNFIMDIARKVVQEENFSNRYYRGKCFRQDRIC